MVADGLNPGKNQVYFIPYGTKLEWQKLWLNNGELSFGAGTQQLAYR